VGFNPFKAPFTPVAFTLFNDSWARALGHEHHGHQAERRASILQGKPSSHPINIVRVDWLNDTAGLPLIKGTCSGVLQHPLRMGLTHQKKGPRRVFECAVTVNEKRTFG
jgi:hypothetical protein